MGPDLATSVPSLSDAEIAEVIYNGSGEMPGFGEEPPFEALAAEEAADARRT